MGGGGPAGRRVRLWILHFSLEIVLYPPLHTGDAETPQGLCAGTPPSRDKSGGTDAGQFKRDVINCSAGRAVWEQKREFDLWDLICSIYNAIRF
jgi:hypothetical protein